MGDKFTTEDQLVADELSSLGISWVSWLELVAHGTLKLLNRSKFRLEWVNWRWCCDQGDSKVEDIVTTLETMMSLLRDLVFIWLQQYSLPISIGSSICFRYRWIFESLCYVHSGIVTTWIASKALNEFLETEEIFYKGNSRCDHTV